jgi:hypothetical protein
MSTAKSEGCRAEAESAGGLEIASANQSSKLRLGRTKLFLFNQSPVTTQFHLLPAPLNRAARECPNPKRHLQQILNRHQPGW